MGKHGIVRRTLSQAAVGDLNSSYTDGHRVGEKEHGYQRKGWNPWNRGLRKEDDAREAAVAETIREAMLGHPTLFKRREEWTEEDCRHHTRAVAHALRVREADLYEEFLALLGDGWVTEHFEDEFVYPRPDGLWQGYIVDIAHPVARVAVEVDGHYHSFPCQDVRDRTRDARLQTHGWKVVRVNDPDDLRSQMDVVRIWVR
jgi:very-short-patch-repair endonuclease